MKKFLLVLVVLVVVALLTIAPFFVGKTAENQFYSAQSHMQSSGITVSSTYTRGWFGSQAESQLNLYELLSKVVSAQQREMVLPMTSFVIHTDHMIQHGPIVLNSFDGYHSVFKPVVAAIMNKSTLTGPTNALPTPIRFSTFTTMEIDGSYNTDFSLASGEHIVQGPNPITIHYDTVAADLNISRDFREFSFALAAPSIALNDEEMAFSVSNIIFGAEMGKGSHDIALGTVSTHVANVVFSLTDDGEQANLKNLSLFYEISEANSNATFTMDTAFQSLDAADEQYGPATLSYAVRNLDIEALSKIQKLIADLQNAQQNEQSANVNTFFLMTQMLSAGQQLLAKSPEIEITTLNINTPDGVFTGSALVTFHPVESLNLMNMMALLDIITADIHVAMPAAFVEENILNQDVQTANPQMAFLGNLLMKSGEEYILDAKFEKGILKVNGQEIPLPMQ